MDTNLLTNFDGYCSALSVLHEVLKLREVGKSLLSDHRDGRILIFIPFSCLTFFLVSCE